MKIKSYRFIIETAAVATACLALHSCTQSSPFSFEGLVHERSADAPPPVIMPLGNPGGNDRDDDSSDPNGPSGWQDTFIQNYYAAGTKIDALWVIDNSGSMSDDQDSVAANADHYTDAFLSQSTGLDIHLGIITTEWRCNGNLNLDNYGGVLTGSDLNQFGSIVDNIGIKEASDHCLNISGDPTRDEQGLEAARRALDPDYGPLNDGFLRSDALLQVMIVSDEEAGGNSDTYDTAPGATPALVQELEDEIGNVDTESENDGHFAFVPLVRNYVDFFQDLKGSASKVRSHVIVGFETGACANGANDNVAEIGYRYRSFAKATGGTSLDLCSDWGEKLDVLGKIGAGLRQCFVLGHAVTNESSIAVTVAGSAVSSSDYSFDSSTNQLCFDSLSTVPQGVTIVVTYE